MYLQKIQNIGKFLENESQLNNKEKYKSQRVKDFIDLNWDYYTEQENFLKINPS